MLRLTKAALGADDVTARRIESVVQDEVGYAGQVIPLPAKYKAGVVMHVFRVII